MPRSVKLANGRQWVGQKAAPPTGVSSAGENEQVRKFMKSLKRCEKKVFTFSQHLELRGLAPGLDEVASRTSMRNLRSFVQHSRKFWQNVTI